jgi:hypothetical protein
MKPLTLPTANSLTKESPADLQQLEIGRKDAIDWRTLLAKSRGRALPGSFNPLLVDELFRDQSIYQEKIVRRHVEDMGGIQRLS